MAQVEFEWKADDGVELYGRGWLPALDPKAVVCLVHGLGEHNGRYAHVAEALNRTGVPLRSIPAG
jgi:alpha-beta hydrolase superfamily lysophospholipase